MQMCLFESLDANRLSYRALGKRAKTCSARISFLQSTVESQSPAQASSRKVVEHIASSFIQATKAATNGDYTEGDPEHHQEQDKEWQNDEPSKDHQNYDVKYKALCSERRDLFLGLCMHHVRQVSSRLEDLESH
jgi:hypothetical protein